METLHPWLLQVMGSREAQTNSGRRNPLGHTKSKKQSLGQESSIPRLLEVRR